MKDNKQAKKQKVSKFSIFLIIVDILVLGCFFLAYGPISYFRDLFVTTAMTTMSHRYFAYVLYSEETVKEILDNNKLVEPEENTDSSAINFNPKFETNDYESIYEEQILKKDKGNDIYKLIDISGEGWKGYMVVIYDPSDIKLVFSSNYGRGGQFLSTMASENEALVAMNASGVNSSPGRNPITGTAILNGKVYDVGRKIYKGGGLIGFTKDNVLMLTKKSAKEAIKDGMDRAIEFGPFLIVNGKTSKIHGDGGWGVAPRSVIAQRKDGVVLILCIEGRLPGYSIGASMNDVIDILLRYKAYNAANLDGGTSSTMSIEGKLWNRPSAGGEYGGRTVSNAWIVTNKQNKPAKAPIKNNYK